MKISKKMETEIGNAAKHLGMDEEEALEKFASICEKNGVDASENEQLALSLWRQYFVNLRSMQAKPAPAGSSNSGGSNAFYKQASGFFATADDPFDMMAIQREKAVAEYERDGSNAYNTGIVAIATATSDGTYDVKQTYRGKEVEKNLPHLPENHVEVSEGTFVIPLDTLDQDWNKARYGKPLPKEEWRMQGVFFGMVDGKMGKWFFHYRGPSAQEFTPDTFRLLHFSCVLNSNDPSKIHGAKATTLGSLLYDDDLDNDHELKMDFDDEDVSEFQDALMEHSSGNYSPLIDLEAYHATVEEKAYTDRFVFTDGTVNSINMNVSEKTGNRIINLDDITTFGAGDFDYGGEQQSLGVTCWIPEKIPINFGIGSEVVVVGRTTQGTDQETGELRPVSINVLGLLPTNITGSVPDAITSDGDDDDWILPDADDLGFSEGDK